MNDAAKRKSSLSAGLTVLRTFLLIIACSGLNLSWAVPSTEAETRVWAFPAQPELPSSQIAFATPSFVGENYDVWPYDALSSRVAARGGAGVADDAFSHGLKYHPRIRARGVEDGVGHNFPYSFDDAILKTKPITQADGSLLYRMPGNINKTDGVFEMAVNPQTQTIFHRQFRGN